MKVIFLDIDGVLNSFSGLVKRGGQGLIGVFHEHEEILDWVLRLTGAKIVISSSWRKGKTLKEFQFKTFTYRSICKAVIDMTPSLGTGIRGDEIKLWLDKSGYSVEEFVILDDDSDMSSLMDHLVKTKNDHGHTYTEGLKVVEKLIGGEKAFQLVFNSGKVA